MGATLEFVHHRMYHDYLGYERAISLQTRALRRSRKQQNEMDPIWATAARKTLQGPVAASLHTSGRLLVSLVSGLYPHVLWNNLVAETQTLGLKHIMKIKLLESYYTSGTAEEFACVSSFCSHNYLKHSVTYL